MAANQVNSSASEQTNEIAGWHGPNEWQSHGVILQAMIDSIVAGEVSALNKMTPDRPAMFRGSTAYYESWQFLIDNLRPHGFLREEVNNQLRLVVPPVFIQQPSRLLLCRGRREGNQMEVNPKGSLTRVLINHQNALFGPQQHLDIFDRGEAYRNYWIVSEVRRTLLTVYLTLPYWINGTGTMIESLDAVVLHAVDLNTVPYSPADMPQSQPIEVILEDRDGTDG